MIVPLTFFGGVAVVVGSVAWQFWTPVRKWLRSWVHQGSRVKPRRGRRDPGLFDQPEVHPATMPGWPSQGVEVTPRVAMPAPEWGYRRHPANAELRAFVDDTLDDTDEAAS